MTTDPTPLDLVRAIHAADSRAWTVLEQWCRPPIAALIKVMAGRLGSAGEDTEVLISRALRWLVMYLRSRDTIAYQDVGRETFVRSLVLAAFRWLDPFASDGLVVPLLHPGQLVLETYELREHRQPLDHVGGDWWCHESSQGQAGALWVIVADVTGHGYGAYLVAAGLPHLWQSRPIASLRARAPALEPRAVLDALGRELESVLPEGIFVEAVLGRFSSRGEAVLAAAGACRPILRRSEDCAAEFHLLSGCFLGLELGHRDQRDWTLHPGDEMLLATDGLFDQPCGDQRLHARLPECAGAHLSAGRDLHEAVVEVLDEALRSRPQHDDITVVTLRHRAGFPAPEAGDARM
jgi:hypothetical protein